MSEVLRLEPLPAAERLDPALARTVEQLLRRCFAARRKMLRNSLAGLLGADALGELAEEVGIALDQRPQELPAQRWVALATGLNRRIAMAPDAPPATHG
jgi:16S rRNA (adenine1518-N6/adenine1519-N6)-dimethyltransferase